MGIKQLGADAAPALRRVTPGPIFSGLRSMWRVVVRGVDATDGVMLKLSYVLHRLGGGSFHSWYRGKLNHWASTSRLSNVEYARRDVYLMESGKVDVELVKDFGLKPESTLMEYGCGWLRAGNYFINYLNAGNYIGVDPADERIRIGREIFSIRNIEDKNPTFYGNEDNSMTWMQGRKVDFIWCHAVFGHLPLEDCEDIIKHMKLVMHEDSQFLFTYNPIPDERDNDPTALVTLDVRNFLQPSAFFREACERHGMVFEDHRAAAQKYHDPSVKEQQAINVKEGLGVVRLKPV